MFKAWGWHACQARDISIPKTNPAAVLKLLASGGEHFNLLEESDSIRRLQIKLEKHQALKFLSKQVFLSGKLRINLPEGTVDAKAEEFFVHMT